MSLSNGLIRLTRFHPRIQLENSRSIPYAVLGRRVYTSEPVVQDRSPNKTLDSLSDALRTPEHIHAIHYNYPTLVAELKGRRKGAPVPPPLNIRHLVAILQMLGESGRPPDLQRIEEILSDMPSVFGVEPSVDIHTVVLRALRKRGNLHTMYRWLLHMPLRPGNFSPTLEHFHLVLETCAEFGSFKQMRNMVLSMRKTGCKPTIETFKLLIRARWDFAAEEEKVPHIIVFSTILDDMKREGFYYDQSISDLLFAGYAERGIVGYAEQIQALYRQKFLDVQTPDEEASLLRNLQLSQVAQSRGLKAAIATFRTLEKEGCAVDSATVRSLLRHSRSSADLRYTEQELGIKASVEHYSLLVSNCVRTGHFPNALAMYDEAKRAGMRPVAGLVAPLIKHLCQTSGGSPLEESLDKAIVLYDDLLQSNPPIEEKQKASYREHASGPDLNVYQTLLRGFASSTNVAKYFPTALSLLKDMDERNIAISDSITASSIIVLHMRHATSPAEALNAYRTYRQLLDEKGYSIVLSAYSKLTFGDEIHIPSLTDYFGIVKDMRVSCHAVTVEVYTILLQQLSIIATRLNNQVLVSAENNALADLQSLLVTTTRRTHDLLTLDAGISPDAHVWNQLMDTYQRLGCFGDAYRVWELMYLSGRFDHASVSIILDACGYAGAWRVAKQIYTRLTKDRFKFNQRNWNTWIECLCRFGQLDDAVKVVCLGMGKDGEVSPDVESVRILHKFSRKTNQQMEVLLRIQRYLPDLWKSLPSELQHP
ncbi:hypothetical protein AX17_000180 [Amanita inopinata Kibby_2008]|nr:hypothetical protein AX17_000180 [Amanita inopinata Kibby_2008]